MQSHDSRPFSLPGPQRELLEKARRVSQGELRRVADRGGSGVDRELLSGLADTGLLPRIFSRDAGGSSSKTVSALDLCVLREGLAQGSPEAETALALQGLGGYPIVQSDASTWRGSTLLNTPVRSRRFCASRG